MGAGLFILCFNVDIHKMKGLEAVWWIAISYVAAFMISIFSGLGGMFGTDLYLYIKKNLNDEGFRI